MHAGVDMRQLLEVPPADIKIPREVNGSIFGAFGHFHFLKFIVQGVQFVLGQQFARVLREAIYRIVPSGADDSSSLGSIDS